MFMGPNDSTYMYVDRKVNQAFENETNRRACLLACLLDISGHEVNCKSCIESYRPVSEQ